MKVKFNLIVVFMTIVVVGCQNSVLEAPIVISPTPSQLPISTITTSSTPTSPLSITPSAAPYPTFPPYPTKEIIFSYSDLGNHSVFDVALDSGTPNSRITLYADGQLIISGRPYRQKQLSSEEISQLFSQLESMGFYSLETNQKHDLTDLLYDFRGQYEQTHDG